MRGLWVPILSAELTITASPMSVTTRRKRRRRRRVLVLQQTKEREEKISEKISGANGGEDPTAERDGERGRYVKYNKKRHVSG